MKNEIIKKLDWNNPLEDQMQAVEQFAKDQAIDPAVFLQPGGKRCWANAALVLLIMGYKRVKGIAPGLFRWLQDLNWPGAGIIMELLYTFPDEELIAATLEAKKQAQLEKDDAWLYFIEEFEGTDNRVFTIINNHMRKNYWE